MSERELTVQRCEGCGRILYPARLACSVCGSAALESDVGAGGGSVVDAVDLSRAPGGSAAAPERAGSGGPDADSGGPDAAAAASSPPRFVLVLLDAGPRVLARTNGMLERHDRVRLTAEASGAVVAHADV